jgi:hypothetical protein
LVNKTDGWERIAEEITIVKWLYHPDVIELINLCDKLISKAVGVDDEGVIAVKTTLETSYGPVGHSESKPGVLHVDVLWNISEYFL